MAINLWQKTKFSEASEIRNTVSNATAVSFLAQPLDRDPRISADFVGEKQSTLPQESMPRFQACRRLFEVGNALFLSSESDADRLISQPLRISITVAFFQISSFILCPTLLPFSSFCATRKADYLKTKPQKAYVSSQNRNYSFQNQRFLRNIVKKSVILP